MMGFYIDSVNLALSRNNLKIAKELAIQCVDEDKKKKLWILVYLW